jgi:protein-S-isoprenylcysteine O-methyltransferase Ste14
MQDGKRLRTIFFLPVLAILVVVPALLILIAGMQWGWGLPVPWGGAVLLVSLVLWGMGVWLLAQTAPLLSQRGESTLAPWDPTRRLVVRGVYRHVRNPMMVGVFCILLGEAFLFGSFAVAAWTGLFAVVNLVGVPLVEEPGLEKRFGQSYALYKKNVPRWLPRRTPWELPDDEK